MIQPLLISHYKMNKRKFYQDIGSDDELCDRQSMTSSQEDLTSHSTYDMDCYDNDTGQLDNLLANTNLSPILDPSLMEKKRLKLEINEHISINEIIEHISVHASAAKDFRSQYLVLVKTLHGIKLKIDIRHSMTNDSISVGELKQLILEKQGYLDQNISLFRGKTLLSDSDRICIRDNIFMMSQI